jgi:hypothetical protein
MPSTESVMNGMIRESRFKSPAQAAEFIWSIVKNDHYKTNEFLKVFLQLAMADFDDHPKIVFEDKDEQTPLFCIRYSGTGHTIAEVNSHEMSDDLRRLILEYSEKDE